MKFIKKHWIILLIGGFLTWYFWGYISAFFSAGANATNTGN